MTTPDELRAALAKIADVASAALTDHEATASKLTGAVESPVVAFDAGAGCILKRLPDRLLDRAAKTAMRINPANGVALGPVARALSNNELSPLLLTLFVSKYWGAIARQLTVSFMEPTPLALQQKIMGHLNAWSTRAGISFALTNGTGQVRIARGSGGYWSYLGTDILQVPANRPTMNLQGFTLTTPEAEFRRVVRHEAGHTLGFPHEHMRKDLVDRIDPQKAYAYFLRTQGWSKSVVDAQVLTSLNEASIMGTPADQTSIMCYQLPGSIMKNGQPIPGGTDINATDYAFAAKIYPKPDSGAVPQPATDEWDAAEDVDAESLEAAIRNVLPTDGEAADQPHPGM